MAFEGLYKFCTEIERMHNATEDIGKQILLLGVLITYYETALASAKFKDQRMYCQKVIHRISPHFFKGYFKKEKP